MLLLSRKKGEKILIGSGIEVVVVELAKNRVRIGVIAPVEVPVHREEVARRLALKGSTAVGPICNLSASLLPTQDGLPIPRL